MGRNTEKRQYRIRLAALIVSLIALAGIVSVIYMGRDGADAGKGIEATEQAEDGTASAGGEDAAGSESAGQPAEAPEVLFFASDYQRETGWAAPAETLSGILKKVREDGKSPTNVIYCGDYTNDRRLHDYQISPDESIAEIREAVSRECPDVKTGDMVFEQGNHDLLTDMITPTGLHEYDNYLVYVLNTQYDFPWKQGRDPAFRDRVKSAAAEMKECFDGLAAKGEKRPVFIAGHVPLHFTARTSSRHTTGDNMYAAYIFDAVNEAASSLDIIYMFGHNHSKGWDCYMGGSSVFKTPGDTLLVPDAGDNTYSTDDFKEKKLRFTYMNAGYTGYYMNCGPEELDNGTYGQYRAADETLTGTVCEIMPDEIVITRYSGEGIHPLGWEGEGDPYKGNIDEGLIGKEHYSTRRDSPAHIRRKNAGDP